LAHWLQHNIYRSQGEKTMTAILINQLKLFPQQHRIYRGKVKIDLQPKCAELLLFLANHPGEVISKETLLSAIWGDAVVGDDVLTNCIRKLRRQLNDDAKSPHVIETITKKGYRMIAKVRPPKTRNWWFSLIAKILIAIICIGYFSIVMTHSNVQVYRFTDTDTAVVRQAKLEKMAGVIAQDPNNIRSLSITIKDD